MKARAKRQFSFKEGLKPLIVVSANEGAKLTNDDVINGDRVNDIDEDLIEYYFLDLIIREEESPFEIRKRLFGRPERNGKKDTCWIIERVYQSAGVQPVDGYYYADRLEGKIVYGYLYKNEKGYTDVYELFTDNDNDDFIIGRFNAAVEDGIIIKQSVVETQPVVETTENNEETNEIPF